MRIASYNVENMLRWPMALDPRTRSANKSVLEAYAELIVLLEKPSYAKDRKQILKLLAKLRLENQMMGRLRATPPSWKAAATAVRRLGGVRT